MTVGRACATMCSSADCGVDDGEKRVLLNTSKYDTAAETKTDKATGETKQ